MIPALDAALVARMTAWRHALHQAPETAFEEHRSAALVREALAALPGIELHPSLTGTDVVATLRGRAPGPTIGLRADLDALHLHEATGLPYASQHPGRMHACGHDGHTAMLLGAASALAADPGFAGTVRFLFQPAEENEGGARVMVEAGLFERHPCDAVYGLHNWPGLPEGTFVVGVGPVMAAFDTFEITLRGAGAHAAKPHQGVDPIIPAAQLVLALQTIPSRRTDPLQAVVVSVTRIHAGETWNVIPDAAVLRGTVRALDPKVHAAVEPQIRQLAEGLAAAHGARAEVTYTRRYPPTVNTAPEAALAAAAAATLGGPVLRDHPPSMGSEDFAFMLQARPGCYAWLGAGPRAPLHSPHYDFNDALLPLGARYWCALVHTALGQGPSGPA